MQRQWATCIFALILLLATAGSASADIKMKTKNTSAGNTSEGTIFIKAPRQRSLYNYGSFEMVTLTQCDLKRTIQINDRARTYLVITMAPAQTTPTTAANQTTVAPNRPPATRRGGVVTYISDINDTGERKKMFGFTARHIKTSMTVESSPDACNPSRFRMESDGWYIDLDFSFNCDNDGAAIASMPQASRPDCKDEIRFKKSGAGKLGYPILVTTTVYLDGGQTSTSTTEVVELTTTPLDASLFDVPNGYTEVKDYQALMGMPSTPSDPSSQPATQLQANSTASQTIKRAGTVRVGVVWIANKTDRSPSVDRLRSRLISGITESNIDAVPLDSRTPVDIEAEAKRKECDYILYTDITMLKTSGKVGGLLGRATGVGALKQKVESRLDFRLFPTGNPSPQLVSSSAAKEDDSEDASLSTAAGQEAKAVIAEVLKRK